MVAWCSNVFNGFLGLSAFAASEPPAAGFGGATDMNLGELVCWAPTWGRLFMVTACMRWGCVVQSACTVLMRRVAPVLSALQHL